MSKPNPKIKSFQLYDGKTPIKLMGLVVAVALFFIGLVLLFSISTNKQIVQNGNQNIISVNKCKEGSNVESAKCVNGINTSTARILNSEEINKPTVVPVVNKQGVLPEGFPVNIPLYENIQIAQSDSFKNTQDGGIAQSVVVYQSNKKVENTKKFYEDWAKKNNWQLIGSSINQTKTVAALSFSQENKRLEIRLDKLLFNTTRVSMTHETIDTQKIQQNFDQMIKGLKLEDIKQ